MVQPVDAAVKTANIVSQMQCFMEEFAVQPAVSGLTKPGPERAEKMVAAREKSEWPSSCSAAQASEDQAADPGFSHVAEK